MIEEVKLMKFRREILRVAGTPEGAQEMINLLSETDWLEVKRIDYETRKIYCNGCSRAMLYKTATHIDDRYYCPVCNESAMRGFACTCDECKQDFISYSPALYAAPGCAHNIPSRICPECDEPEQSSACLVCKNVSQDYWYGDVSICDPCRLKHGIDTLVIREESHKLDAHQRRAIALGLASTLTLDEWFVSILHFDWLCAYCRTLPYEHLDHFIPLCKKGGTVKENCIPSCLDCNVRKGHKHPDKITTIPQSDLRRVREYLKI